MGDGDRGRAKGNLERGKEHQQRNADHDFRRDDRKIEQSLVRPPPPEYEPPQRHPNQRAEHGGDESGDGADCETQQKRVHDIGPRRQRAVPLQGESAPADREFRAVERESDEHGEREMEKGVDYHGPRSEPARRAASTHSGRLRRAVTAAEIDQHGGQHERHDEVGRGRSERPVAGGGELVLDQIADHHLLGAAQQIGGEKRAERGNEHQQ